MHEDQPYTYLYEQRRIGCVNNRLVDVEPNAVSSYFNLRYWRLADGG